MMRPSESMLLQLTLTDWLTFNIQLFNFHAAGALVRGYDAVTNSSEPHGAASSTVICRLWNPGNCIAPHASCCFAHKCQSCFGHHRVKDCPRNLSSQQSAESKQPPASPPHFCSKSRWLWMLWMCLDFVSCHTLVAFAGKGVFWVVLLLYSSLAYV